MQSPARPPRESAVSSLKTRAGAGERSLFGGLFGLFESKPPRPPVEDGNADELFSFPSEGSSRSEPVPRVSAPRVTAALSRAPRSNRRLAPGLVQPLLILVALVVVSGLAVIAIRYFPLLRSAPAEPRFGSLTIDTRLITSEVIIDGKRRGVTPLRLSLPPGDHTITVRSGSDERVVPLTIAAGADVTQYFEMKAAEPASRFGQVSVSTDPPDARVSVDGQARGSSPLTIGGLTPGQHRVSVTSAAGSVERTVMVPAGGTASVVFSPSKASGPVGGWVSISSPFEVQVAENDDVVGTSGASRIMLAAGRHNITLTNPALGYQETRKIEVTAGKTVAIRVDPPKASVSVNARPWAEITLDGASAGQTPIANLLVSVGSHEMIFRHPQLGERKQTIVVTAKGPNRIAVDFTK